MRSEKEIELGIEIEISAISKGCKNLSMMGQVWNIRSCKKRTQGLWSPEGVSLASLVGWGKGSAVSEEMIKTGVPSKVWVQIMVQGSSQGKI